eukprot:maker-scaffold_40-snap-gene-0.1-mRNA-1 protein AED:0.00 eAED:0.00 QI:66/1/1/1/1/1/2/691/299
MKKTKQENISKFIVSRPLYQKFFVSISFVFLFCKYCISDSSSSNISNLKETYTIPELVVDEPEILSNYNLKNAKIIANDISDAHSLENLLTDFQKILLQPEKVASALDSSQVGGPMLKEEDKKLLSCPNVDGGGKNKQCSKGFSTYVFKVKPNTEYFLYVETVAPNIWDNSLWIGTNGDQTIFKTCPRKRAVPLVPHKHLKWKRWDCCPKYLNKNKAKGKDEFYYGCCFDKLGPNGNEEGCMLDLEVNSKPQWNMMPRIFKTRSKQTELNVNLYAREDGTSISRIFLSKQSNLKETQIK